MSASFPRVLLSLLALFVVAGAPVQLVAEEIPWSTNIEGSLKKAAATGKPVLMEFTAAWCGYCKKMEKTTFVDPKVVATINRGFVAVRVDADENKDLVKDLAIKGLPAILIVSPDLQIIERISGFQTPDKLIEKLNQVSARSQQSAPPAIAAARRQPAQPVANTQPRQREELGFEAIPHEEAPLAKRQGNVRPVSQPNQPSSQPQFQQPQRKSPNTQDRVEAQSEEFFAAINGGGAPEERTEVQPPAPKQRTAAPASKTGQRPSFGGSCLVSAVQEREIVPGSANYQMNYRGQLLYFSSEEAKEQFQAQPAMFWPMLDGACAMTLLDDERKVEGDLQFAAVFRKRVWLFSSESNMRDFLSDPADVVDAIAENTADSGR